MHPNVVAYFPYSWATHSARFGFTFSKFICAVLKSVWKDILYFWSDTPFDLTKEKKISSHRRVSVHFLWTKKSKMEATTQYFGKRFFYKQVLEFHRLSKFLCQTSEHQNHWSLHIMQGIMFANDSAHSK